MLSRILGANLRWNQTGVVVAGTAEGNDADELKNPTCLYVDDNDDVYICDFANNRIQKWSPCETSGETVAGSSSGGAGSTSILLDEPEDLVFDRNGFMYVADNENHRVQRFPPNSNIGTRVAGNGVKTTTLTSLDHLTAVDVDNSSNIYILDIHNERVVSWGPNATAGTLLIDSATLKNAQDMILSPNSPNQVYISDPGNDKIYLWSFGASSPALTLSAVGTGTSTLVDPKGMVFDPYGNLYVADFGNDRVVMYCANSTVGIVVASGTAPSIDQPTAVALDSDLNLYVVYANGDKVVAFPRR